MMIELWGGLECTVNRIGDRYHDQIVRSGHEHRASDLDAIASLGIRTLRYPVLWERTEVNGGFDWSWSDKRLDHLSKLNIVPIVGLLHHGSGPKHTSLLDSQFPEKLARFAGSVARRYPWVSNYTPVNEPLTTARFSCLYGHWYPHKRDPKSFALALLAQCKGVALAMREIRRVNSAARLIQTEDLGKIYSTRALAYQAEFENCRRWLTWDLLFGHVDRTHPMWNYFCWLGIREPDLVWFLENPSPPDVVGMNHYVTSDRYLDEAIELYPSSTWGGNGRHRYADVEAIRVLPSEDLGTAARIREVAQRYSKPIAITEAHLGCEDEIEQLRWFREVWDAAVAARNAGAQILAVTTWAMLGAYDWDSLLTVEAGNYERGAFELIGEEVRATPLARYIKKLSSAGWDNFPRAFFPHDCGWWRKPERICYGIGASSAQRDESSNNLENSIPR